MRTRLGGLTLFGSVIEWASRWIAGVVAREGERRSPLGPQYSGVRGPGMPNGPVPATDPHRLASPFSIGARTAFPHSVQLPS
jgi:hypothetical protein